MKNAVEIFSKSHGGERDRRSEADGRRNKSGHEAEGGMINLGKEMIFATGARERGAQLTVAERAAERGDSTDNPKHQQSKTRVNIGDLKSKTGEDASADNICNHDPAGCVKSDRSLGSSQMRPGRVGGFVHVGIDHGICASE